MRSLGSSEAECAIAQAAAVVGEWWTLLILRDVAGGIIRFDDLQAELAISRKVLSERLATLVADGVLERRLYQARPPRYEYHLTPAGRELVPVLIALQDWGSRFVLGDGTVTATSGSRSREARRLRNLVGVRVPPLSLAAGSGRSRDPVQAWPWTVVFCYPGAYAASSAYPIGWSEIPGAAGCTLQATMFRDRIQEFAARGVEVVGVSTQRPEEQAAFTAKARIPYPLLCDQDLQLAAALRLPTFRAAGRHHLKRLTLIVRGDREIRHVLYPIADPVASVEQTLALLDRRVKRRTRSSDGRRHLPARARR
jgi:DNA-binding HxlR family transcriptional regulator/peroxiredoxin